MFFILIKTVHCQIACDVDNYYTFISFNKVVTKYVVKLVD